MMPENVISARCRACVPPGSGEAWVRQSGNPVAISARLACAYWMPDTPSAPPSQSGGQGEGIRA